jgi:hypothetical protein
LKENISDMENLFCTQIFAAMAGQHLVLRQPLSQRWTNKNCGAFLKRWKFRCEAVPPCHKGLSARDFGIEDDFPANPAARIRKG